jgi:tRNA G46 methylase TrmB
VVLAHQRLVQGGEFYFQTDNPAYWGYFQKALSPLFQIVSTPDSWSEDPKGRTRREIVAKSQGLSIFRAVAVKVEADDSVYATYLKNAPSAEFDAMDAHPQRRPNRPGRRNSRR